METAPLVLMDILMKPGYSENSVVTTNYLMTQSIWRQPVYKVCSMWTRILCAAKRFSATHTDSLLYLFLLKILFML